MEISLTDFVDFVICSGALKLTIVKSIKARQAYSPQFDFWKKLREGIREYHYSGQTNKKWLDNLSDNLTDPNKIICYPLLIASYQKWLGRKNISCFKSSRNDWVYAGLTVRINPDLGLCINNNDNVVKLYFKDEPINKAKVDIILLLMSHMLSASHPNSQFGVMDVRRGRLISTLLPNPALMPLLTRRSNKFYVHL